MEGTADRREDPFSMTKTSQPKAKLALVSGRSSCSRYMLTRLIDSGRVAGRIIVWF